MNHLFLGWGAAGSGCSFAGLGSQETAISAGQGTRVRAKPVGSCGRMGSLLGILGDNLLFPVTYVSYRNGFCNACVEEKLAGAVARIGDGDWARGGRSCHSVA